jgi:hypothetical protein
MNCGEIILMYVSCMIGVVMGFMVAILCRSAAKGDEELDRASREQHR